MSGIDTHVRPALRPAYSSQTEHRRVLCEGLERARAETLRLLERAERVCPGCFAVATHPEFSPIGWHIGHVATFAGLWILQRLGGAPPLSREFDALFMPATNPKGNRVRLPPRAEVLDYAEAVLERVLQVLARSDFSSSDPLERDGVLFWNILQHEHQHHETIAVVLHQNRQGGLPTPSVTGWGTEPPRFVETPRLEVPGGWLIQGTDATWVYDNERPAHRVEVKPFRIESHPVRNAQFLAFMWDGGYQRRELWSPEGWSWRKIHGLCAPGAWCRHPQGGWFGWGLGEPVILEPDAPVTGVSWYEAEAYAKWRALALPTEAEWEFAASWSPQGERTYPWGEQLPESRHAACAIDLGGPARVGSHPAGQSALGCLDLAGNVWEWTDSWFEPYPGFLPFPYEAYSTPWFDGHRVLRGGAWTTSPLLLRTTFRNWYVPTCRAIMSGIRCVERSR